MNRTPLARLLQRIHGAHRLAAERHVPIDEIDFGAAAVGTSPGNARTSRAQFIARLGAAGATAALATAMPVPGRAISRLLQRPRIVVIGGGLAGVTCAYRLWQAGVGASLFEANRALGGRTWTLRGFFDENQIAEHGGELISSEHVAVRQLAKELDLTLVDVNAAEPPGTDETYFMNGARYTLHEALRDYSRVFDALHDALQAAGYPTKWDHFTRAGFALDHMTVTQWIEQFVPGGNASNLGKLLGLACTSEYGADAQVQSALNLIYLLGFEPRGQLNLGGTDERFHIAGGNDQLVSIMASRLPQGSIDLETPLVALRRNAGGSYTCSFANGRAHFDVTADHVVLALPFTLLREVDFSKAGFNPLKTTSIERLDLGTNAKLHLQFSRRLWYDSGFDGASYSDRGYQGTWEVSRGQKGHAGILVDFTGGSTGRSYHAPAHAPASRDVALDFLAQLEPVFPGIGAAWNGKAFLDFWAADRWHRGSYSYYRTGQYTQFAGYEALRQGNVHFCGEHCSYEFQGYINGAAASGESAAQEVLRDIGAIRSTGSVLAK